MTVALPILASLIMYAPAGSVASGVQEPADSVVVRGKEVYRQQRCRVCHSIDGDGNRRWPLDGVASRLDDEALRKWIVAPQEMQPGIRKRAYDRLSPTNLAALIAYLKTLKQPDES